MKACDVRIVVLTREERDRALREAPRDESTVQVSLAGLRKVRGSN